MEDCTKEDCDCYNKHVDKNCMMKIEYIKRCKERISLMEEQAPVSGPFSVGLDGLQVSEEMLIRAVKEGVKVGILPKHGVSEETYLKHWDGMKKVLQAALAD